ncbi:MAG: hypothetical protein KDA61_11125 [Planctomycetales bacterium]|nr:hypothetical protein [Planctomycetales bacterium]
MAFRQKYRLAPAFPAIRVALIAAISAGVSPCHAARSDGKLTLTAVDESTGSAIPARIELRDARNRLVRLPRRMPEGAAATAEGLYFDGSVTLALPRGFYKFVVEAGPEFLTRPGSFQIDRHAEDSHEVSLKRRIDMRAEGWYAGDVDVSVSRVEDLSLMMRARGVALAGQLLAQNLQGKCQRSPLQDLSAFATPPLVAMPSLRDERRIGELLFLDVGDGFDVCGATGDLSLASIDEARATGAVVIAAEACSWDVPLWVAAGKLDAIALINRRTAVAGGVAETSGHRPRDKRFFPGALGLGQFSETVYHHLLNCGLRIAPVAGSGSGSVANPLGANRTYVHCGDAFTAEAWRDGLRAGRSVVTNGPLLRTKVEGEPPGHVFTLAKGEARAFSIGLELAFYEATHIEYLEILKDGVAIHQIRLDELAQQQGRLPPVPFDGSGWFSVRAVTDNSDYYQYAATGAYFVECDYKPRISRRSVQFFLQWLDDAAQHFAGNDEKLAEISAARPFWEELQRKAAAE